MKLFTLLYIIKYLGFYWLIFRVWFYIKLKSGILRYSTKQEKWASIGKVKGNSQYYLSEFFLKPDKRDTYWKNLNRWESTCLIKQYNDSLEGKFTYFSQLNIHTNIPPDWHYNYFINKRLPDDRHWSRIGDFDNGDIKVVWELNRFSFVYDFVRTFRRTNDYKIPEVFWQLIEDWKKNNPPNTGVNWKCGQEATFRVMAWLWGLYGFYDSPSSTPERIEKLVTMIYFSGIRVERNIGYALSQKNNHSISEAAGLFTIGILFPEFKQSKRWKNKGKKLLEKLIPDLINEEGAFTQNSTNYHRLVLHLLIWVFRLGDLNGEPFSHTVKERFRKAAEFLYQLQDDTTGEVPNYGANDGSLILPLSNCDYRDYRPVLQAAFYYLYRKRIYEEGPWDEELLWLFGPDALASSRLEKEKHDLALHETGYHTFRSPEGFLFTRCGKHIYRPGQADMLHADIWWKGYNIALDPGSYSYNAAPPWDKGLGGTSFHNTVTVDHLEQMDKYAKFLSFPWVTGKVHTYHKNTEKEYRYFEGSHNGYHRLKDPVGYRRGILNFGDDNWIVIDKVYAQNAHTYRLHWLLKHFPHRLYEKDNLLTLYPDDDEYRVFFGSLNENAKMSLVTADEKSPRGWWSPYYYYKEPALSLDLIVNDTSTVFYTVMGPEVNHVRPEENALIIQSRYRETTLQLNPEYNNEPVLTDIDPKPEVIGI